MRQRWFGATREQVPQIVVEGEFEFPSQPLVLENAADEARIREEFDKGTPIVVRASSADQVVAALRRPEVACVAVPPERRELLDLDLIELTYGD